MLGTAERVLIIEHDVGPAVGSELLLVVFVAFVLWRWAWLGGKWLATRKSAPRRSGGR